MWRNAIFFKLAYFLISARQPIDLYRIKYDKNCYREQAYHQSVQKVLLINVCNHNACAD